MAAQHHGWNNAPLKKKAGEQGKQKKFFWISILGLTSPGVQREFH